MSAAAAAFPEIGRPRGKPSDVFVGTGGMKIQRRNFCIKDSTNNKCYDYGGCCRGVMV